MLPNVVTALPPIVKLLNIIGSFTLNCTLESTITELGFDMSVLSNTPYTVVVIGVTGDIPKNQTKLANLAKR